MLLSLALMLVGCDKDPCPEEDLIYYDGFCLGTGGAIAGESGGEDSGDTADSGDAADSGDTAEAGDTADTGG